MAREVLPTGGQAASLQFLDQSHAERRDILGALGQRAVADHRIFRVREDVEHRREIKRDADGTQLDGQRARELARQLDIATAAKRRHRRPQREPALEPRDAAALLVHADPRRQFVGQHRDLARHLGHLCGLLDVAREVDHAAQRELAGQRTEFHRQARAGKSGHEQLSDLVAKVDGRHAVRAWRGPTVPPL